MFENLTRYIGQIIFIPKPTLTEQNLPDQAGRVSIVTGGYTGVGASLSKILYSKNGTVYIAGRSEEKANKAIQSIKQAHSTSKGTLEFLNLDLADLSTIKASVDEFFKKEKRLDVLVNNAGVMIPPAGSFTAQGYELQLGTNCLGPFLFTHYLTPLLEQTAATSAPGSVRVAWAASLTVEHAPKGGVIFDKEGSPEIQKANTMNYAMSKVGNHFLASQYALRRPIPGSGKGVVSLAFNPGNLRTELQRHIPSVVVWMVNLMLFPAIFGAYTELWAGWSEDVRPEDSGRYVLPWGRFGMSRDDIEAQIPGEGGAQRFWDWCSQETKQYL